MECNELLQDLSVNYIGEGLYAPYLNPLITLAEQFTVPDDERLIDFNKQLHTYDILFRNYVANEIFSDLLMPEDTIDDMLLHLEWIAMEYASIRQSLFLLCSAEGANHLSYETVRDYIVILSRMTGYEDADIREYLENSLHPRSGIGDILRWWLGNNYFFSSNSTTPCAGFSLIAPTTGCGTYISSR